MAVLELDKEQIYRLALQLTPQERQEIARKLADPLLSSVPQEVTGDRKEETGQHPQRIRGKAKSYPFYMADDFDAPLEEMKEYME